MYTRSIRQIWRNVKIAGKSRRSSVPGSGLVWRSTSMSGAVYRRKEKLLYSQKRSVKTCTHFINEQLDCLVITGLDRTYHGGCSGLVVEYRTRNREVAGSTHTRSSASNLELVANLLCAQANSASYPQRDGKWVVATATGWRPNVADWGDGVSAGCTVGPIVR